MCRTQEGNQILKMMNILRADKQDAGISQRLSYLLAHPFRILMPKIPLLYDRACVTEFVAEFTIRGTDKT